MFKYFIILILGIVFLFFITYSYKILKIKRKRKEIKNVKTRAVNKDIKKYEKLMKQYNEAIKPRK